MIRIFLRHRSPIFCLSPCFAAALLMNVWPWAAHPSRRQLDSHHSQLKGWLTSQCSHSWDVPGQLRDEETCQRLWREARVRISVWFPGCPVRVENRFLPFLHEVKETQCSTGSQFAAPGAPAVNTYLLQRLCHHCNWGGLLAGWAHMMASLWSTWNDLCSCLVK